MSESKASKAVSEAEISAQDRALLNAFLNAKVEKRPTPLKQPGTKAAAGDFTVISFEKLVVRPSSLAPATGPPSHPSAPLPPGPVSRRVGHQAQGAALVVLKVFAFLKEAGQFFADGEWANAERGISCAAASLSLVTARWRLLHTSLPCSPAAQVVVSSALQELRVGSRREQPAGARDRLHGQLPARLW